jgi:hypothetical protein
VSHDAFHSIESIKNTLRQVFPDKEIPIYKATDNILLGVVEDFDSNRFLLVGAHGWMGSWEITRNDTEVNPPFEEETVDQYGGIVDETGSHEDRSRIHSGHLGFWIPLSGNETFSIVADLEAPEAAHVKLTYSPKNGWEGSITLHAEKGN